MLTLVQPTLDQSATPDPFRIMYSAVFNQALTVRDPLFSLRTLTKATGTYWDGIYVLSAPPLSSNTNIRVARLVKLSTVVPYERLSAVEIAPETAIVPGTGVMQLQTIGMVITDDGVYVAFCESVDTSATTTHIRVVRYDHDLVELSQCLVQPIRRTKSTGLVSNSVLLGLAIGRSLSGQILIQIASAVSPGAISTASSQLISVNPITLVATLAGDDVRLLRSTGTVPEAIPLHASNIHATLQITHDPVSGNIFESGTRRVFIGVPNENAGLVTRAPGGALLHRWRFQWSSPVAIGVHDIHPAQTVPVGGNRVHIAFLAPTTEDPVGQPRVHGVFNTDTGTFDWIKELLPAWIDVTPDDFVSIHPLFETATPGVFDTLVVAKTGSIVGAQIYCRLDMTTGDLVILNATTANFTESSTLDAVSYPWYNDTGLAVASLSNGTPPTSYDVNLLHVGNLLIDNPKFTPPTTSVVGANAVALTVDTIEVVERVPFTNTPITFVTAVDATADTPSSFTDPTATTYVDGIITTPTSVVLSRQIPVFSVPNDTVYVRTEPMIPSPSVLVPAIPPPPFPLTIPGLIWWLDAHREDLITTDSQPIVLTIEDRSPLGRTASSANLAIGPTIDETTVAPRTFGFSTAAFFL